jgi:hypothetical protein
VHAVGVHLEVGAGGEGADAGQVEAALGEGGVVGGGVQDKHRHAAIARS